MDIINQYTTCDGVLVKEWKKVSASKIRKATIGLCSKRIKSGKYKPSQIQNDFKKWLEKWPTSNKCSIINFLCHYMIPGDSIVISSPKKNYQWISMIKETKNEQEYHS